MERRARVTAAHRESRIKSLRNIRMQSILPLVVAAFVLNFAWEMVQGRLYADMAGLSLWAASRRCLLATVGDVAITVTAYCVVAGWMRKMNWMSNAATKSAVLFCMSAFSISVVIERHAVAAGRWHYASDMTLVPWLGIGWAPAAQWIVLPLLLFALARRFASP